MSSLINLSNLTIKKRCSLNLLLWLAASHASLLATSDPLHAGAAVRSRWFKVCQVPAT